MTSSEGTRLPEFLIIGTMKSGTTTLFRWLDSHPDVQMPSMKEPDFFVGKWTRGIHWYRDQFPARPAHTLSGEASVSYTAPDKHAIAAARIADSLPDGRLICLLRHPLERARSHYRHMVQRGVEKRSFEEAATEPLSDYIRYSRYGECLSEYVESFGDRLLLIRFEDLVEPPHTAWHRALSFLSLDDVKPPETPFNVTSSKARYTRPMRLFRRSRWAVRVSRSVPFQVRKLVRPLFIRDSPEYQRMMIESNAVRFPDSAASLIWDDIEQLEHMVNDGRELWPRDQDGRS